MFLFQANIKGLQVVITEIKIDFYNILIIFIFRYEVLEFNSWLGSKDKHEIWDFYDYSKDFSFRSVFDTEDCKYEYLTYFI